MLIHRLKNSKEDFNTIQPVLFRQPLCKKCLAPEGNDHQKNINYNEKKGYIELCGVAHIA